MDQTRRSALTPREAPPPVDLPPALHAAADRLTAALTRLKAAGERRATGRGEREGDEDAPALVQQDRTRLAIDLEAALARVARLGDAHAAALERLGRAEASIDAVLRELTEEEEVEEPPVEEAS